MKKSSHALMLAVAALALVLALWLTLTVALVGSTLTPAQRHLLEELVISRSALAVLSALIVLALAAIGLRALVHRHVVAPAMLLEQSRTLLDAGAHQTPLPDLAPPLEGLQQLIHALATRRDQLVLDVQREVARASAGALQERDQLSALIAGLSQGVMVCNLDGRIVLLNHRARLQFQALSGEGGTSSPVAPVGIGRSVYAVLDRQLLAHALDNIRLRLSRGATHPGAGFVTATRGAQLLRVQVAPVAAEGNALQMQGFVLVMTNLTAAHREATARDQRLLSLCAAMTACVDTLQTACATVSASGTGGPGVALLPTVQQEVDRLKAHLGALGQHATLGQQTRWPLEDMLGSDLLGVARIRLAQACRCDVVVQPPGAELWLKADSYSLLQALAYLARRLVDEFGIRVLTLRMRQAGGAARLDLVWSGHAVNTETVLAWELDAMDPDADGTTLSVRDVVARHQGELAFERERSRHEACLCFILPLATDHGPERGDQPHAANLAGRGADHDLTLLAWAQGDVPMDERPLGELAYTVFDTETTGLNPSAGDAIVQLGAVRIVNGRVIAGEAFDELVDPQRPIPAAATRIHGITQAQVQGRPGVSQVLREFHAFARDTVLVAHNAAFDMKLLRMQEAAAGVSFGQPVLDTLLLSAVVQPSHAPHTLEAIAGRLGIELHARHTALGDAQTTAQAFLKFIPLLQAMGIHTLGQARTAALKTHYAQVKY